MVGALEYLSALRNLDAFVRSATSEELAAADKIVSSQPQFTVFTRLSDRFRQVSSQPQALGNPGGAPQRGLMWVVALARLEAGAILATFTTLPAPFEIVGPTRWDLPAYKELLMDGAQTHFLALLNDANVKVVAMKVPDTEMLAYIRRLNLARAMLSAAARSNVNELSPQDWSQLATQDRQLLSMRNLFAKRVSQYVEMLNSTSVNQTVSQKQKTSVIACRSQLAGEQRELARGTAKVRTFAVK